LRGASVIGGVRRVLDRAASGVLITMARVLNQLAFGFLEAFGLTLSRFHQRALRGVPFVAYTGGL
jgi:hypothetical protein